MQKITDEINFKFIKKEYNRYLILLLSVLIVIILGITDYSVSYEISFSIFYLIPISITALLAGFKFSIIVSTLSALAWFLADTYGGHVYRHSLIPFWNSLVRLIYFMLHSFFLSQFYMLYNKTRFYSLTDPLTGAVNSRFFHELFGRELKRAERSKKAFTLVYLDLDNFKCINDTFGHAAGDSLLQRISQLIRAGIRGSDVLARMGGDEFAILFPESDYDLSCGMIQRIQEKINYEMLANKWPVTVSIGAITYNRFNDTIGDMIRQADSLMYSVKRNGKNNIEHQSVE